MSKSHPAAKPLSLRQVIFVAALLVLGLQISVLVVRFLDPARAREASPEITARALQVAGKCGKHEH